MSRKQEPKDAGDVARRALRDAVGPEAPDVSRLVEAVPAMMAEARRRRQGRARIDPLAALVPIAHRAIPLMATAAAGLVLVALLFGSGETTELDSAVSAYERLILTGEVGDGASDLLLETIAEEGGADNG